MNPPSTIPSAKETAAQLVALLQVPEAEFDFDTYACVVENYSHRLIVEMASKIHERTTREVMAGLLREYCQRFDGVVNRVQKAMSGKAPMFPLFRGAFFCRYVMALKDSTHFEELMRDIEYAVQHLPYGRDDVILQTILADARKQVRQAQEERITDIKQQIAEIIDAARTKSKPEFLSAVREAAQIVRIAGNPPGLLLFLYGQIGGAAMAFTDGRL